MCKLVRPEKPGLLYPTPFTILFVRVFQRFIVLGISHLIIHRGFHKVFEIFIHALEFPPNSIYCEKCPGELEKGESEDFVEKETEVSIIDGINMEGQRFGWMGGYKAK